MSVLMQTQVFNHKKQTAQQALNNNRLQQALELYTEALQIAETLPHLFPEIPKILSNRSLVYYKLALDDANLSTNLDPLEIKGYWRAAQVHKKLGQVNCALDCIIRGYNVSVSQDQEEEILRFLVEVVSIIITLRYDPKNLLKNSEIHPGSIQTQRKLLQQLASNNCWEGVSLLVMGVHAGPPSTLDASATSCPIDNLSVGNLLKNTSIPELKRFGVELAVCLLKSGASYEDIELKMEKPVIHVGLKVALDTGKISLVKLMFSQYLKTPETKDALNRDGKTAFHVLVHSGRINDSIRETLLRLLINNGCQSSIPDRNGKLAIDYLTPNDLGFNILSTTKVAAVKEEVLRQNQQQEKQIQTKENREEGERRRLEMEEVESRRQLQNQRKADEARKKEPIKAAPLDSYCKEYCEPRIDEAKALLQENNMRHAYLRFAEVLKKDHSSEKHNKMEEMALDILITSLGKSFNPEIPDKLAKIPHKLYEQIINGLAVNEKWRQMYFMVKEHRLHNGDLSLSNFAKSMSLAKVIRHSSFQGSEQLLVDVVDCMMNGGAVLDEDGKLAILAAVQECKFKVLQVLLRWGADPVHLTINQGDTPIHAALSIALERDKGNFSILNYFFDLYEKDPEKYPMLDPAQINSDGDSLFHLVAKAKYSATTQKATELLCDKKVDASLLNKEGKLPKDYLNPTHDRRSQFFWLASVEEK